LEVGRANATERLRFHARHLREGARSSAGTVELHRLRRGEGGGLAEPRRGVRSEHDATDAPALVVERHDIRYARPV